ncbi:penicillin-binding protein [Paenibacillus glucanolyticus]|uniref:Penicillin-binding protein n=1 Tax=Paenibacillus glucanolyticus TaxID=59843 RepID=A0A163FR76_9BACL|nr:serine hydrolase [Paenibacillus glucanolyticus]KZS44525.1 penicillin-binding protein [Paenibacillus glucanolyticus]
MKWNNPKLKKACLFVTTGALAAVALLGNGPLITVASNTTTNTITSPAGLSAPVRNGPEDVQELLTFADPLFADKMKKFNVAGSNFVVVKDGKVLVSKGYGYADKKKQIPVDSQTVFQIASISKTFTALAAMQLVDQGKIQLDHNIEEYLAGLKIPNKTGKPITMFDLLTYTSGVDKPDITTYVSPEYVRQDIPTREFLEKHMPTVVRPPGEAYTYDNFAFLLAGYAVENMSGMRYDQYMKKNIFEPLGMKSTSVRFTPELLARLASHYSPAGEFQPLSGHAPTDGPQGSILSTGEDMAQYLLMQLQNGRAGDKQLVSLQSLKQMHTYQTFAEASIPIATVGFEGYYKELMNGHHVVLKGGNMPGHSSLMVLIPEHNTGFYMSYNNDTNMSLEIYEAFMDHYFPETEASPQPAFVELSKEEAKPYTGIYQNTRAFSIRTQFAYENGHLTMEDSTTGKHTLQKINALLFQDELGNKVSFKKGAAGQIQYFYYTSPVGLGVVAESQKMESKPPFADVPSNSKFRTHIDHLQTLGLIQGIGGNRFDPKGTMTQGQFADLLIPAHGWNIFPVAAKANQQQMIQGIPGYHRSKPITRQVAAVMIQNLRQLNVDTKVTLSGSTDAWAVEAVQALVGNGVVDPDTRVQQDGSVHFRSKQLLLRQEACALLDKAFNYYALPIALK